METKTNDKNILNTAIVCRFVDQTRKEVKMSAKSFIKILVSAGLLVIIMLVAEGLFNISSQASTSDKLMTDVRMVGSDYFERHPEVFRPANFYFGSDYIERHPEIGRPVNYYVGSDYIERHPQDPYAGSDWIERHPSQP
jgi:hypothetical protein